MYNLNLNPENRQKHNWGTTTLFPYPRKTSRVLFLPNPIWAGKLHSYIRSVLQTDAFSAQVQNTISCRIVDHIFHTKTTKHDTEVVRPCSRIQEKRQDVISVSNPILAGKLHSFTKKCITYKPTHCEHRFKTLFSAESWIISYIIKVCRRFHTAREAACTARCPAFV